MKNSDDSHLIALSRNGNSDAFGELIRRYAEAVKGYCYYRTGSFDDACDLCQETFILAYTKLYQLNSDDRLGAWLHRIAANLCARWITNRREFPVEQVESEHQVSESHVTFPIGTALAQLPDNERLAVIMHYVDGYSYDEIADFIGTSKGAVRGRLQRGRTLLRKELLLMTGEAFSDQKLDPGFTARTISLTRSFTRLGLGWSPDGKRILFLRYLGDRLYQLWVTDTNGVDAHPVSEPGWQECYTWSPDSTRVVYAHAPNRNPESPLTLNIYDAGKAESRVMASGFVVEALDGFGILTGWSRSVWSPDSRHIALLVGRNAPASPYVDTVIFDADTGRSVPLTPGHLNAGNMYPGDWFADGERFILTSCPAEGSNYRMWVCNRDGGDLHPITDENWKIGMDPRVQPHGENIAFCTSHLRPEDEAKNHYLDLWLMKPDGKDPRRLTDGQSQNLTERVSYGYPEWTSDGRYIVSLIFRYDGMGRIHQGIRIVDTKTGEIIRVLESDPESDEYLIGFRTKISLCPNGHRVAFTVGSFKLQGPKAAVPVYKDRQDILYYFDIPSRKLHELQRTNPEQDGEMIFTGGYSWAPLWSPDGEKLLFTKANVIDKNAWKREAPGGRIVYKWASIFDALQPEGEQHLCMMDIGK
jgi:RNA polymerase sigma-70 factor (ECF subfamily)